MSDDLEVLIENEAIAAGISSMENGGENGDEMNGELVAENALTGAGSGGGETKSTGVGSTDSNDSGLAGDHSSPEHLHHDRAATAVGGASSSAAEAAADANARSNAGGRKRPNGPLKIPPYPGFGGSAYAANGENNGFYSTSNDKYSPIGETMDCEFGMDSISGTHVVYVHVNIGETLNVRVGNEVQHIAGPATVRMVSRYASRPAPLPLEVPPGHIVQQIVDECGTLKHLVLSPETGASPNGIAGPFHFVNMTNGYVSPDGQYVDAGLSPFYDGSNIYSVSPVPSDMDMGNQEIHEYSNNRSSKEQPPPPPFQRMYCYKRPYYTNSYNNDRRFRVIPPRIGGGGGRRRRSCTNREQFVQTNDRFQPTGTRIPPAAKPFHYDNDSSSRAAPFRKQLPIRERFADAASNNVRVSAVAVATTMAADPIVVGVGGDEEEITKIREMLSRIPPPRVSDIGARSAFVQWQPFDCTEASANGGSFPQIDSSEFTYEIALFECQHEQGPVFSHRSQANLFPQTWLKNLKPATDYSVRLRASLDERLIVGEPSASVFFITKPAPPEKPDPPCVIQKSRTFLLIKWQETARDNGSPVTSYHLEIRDSGDESSNFTEVYTGMNNQFKLTNLKPAACYQLRLASSNACGKGEYSDLLVTTTSDGGAPSAPAAPSLVRATSDSLTIQWVKRECDEEFELMVDDPEMGFQETLTTKDVVSTVTDLANFRQYQIHLRSSNEDGRSPFSDVVTFSTLPPKPTAPSKPTIKGSISDCKARIAWQITGNDDVAEVSVQFIMEMMVMDRSSTDWIIAYCGPEPECDVSNLEHGSICRLRVNCESAGGRSEWSEELIFTVPAVAPGACAAPTMAQEPSPNSLHLQWNPPEFSGGSVITEYELTITMTSKSTTPGENREKIVCYRGPNTSAAVSSGLLPGRAYSFRVRAFNAVGAGQWSEAFVCGTTPLPPDCPNNLRVIDVKARSVGLVWDPPPDAGCGDDGTDQLEYWLYRKVVGTANSLTCASEQAPSDGDKSVATSLPAPDSGEEASSTIPADIALTVSMCVGSAPRFEAQSLSPGTEYEFHVIAANKVGKSAGSATVKCRTLPDAPDAPRIVKIEALSTSEIMVCWDASADNGSAITCFHFEVILAGRQVPDLVFPISLPGDCRQHIVENLSPSTVYRFMLKAVSDLGCSDWSDVSEAVTRSLPPPAPKIELASATHNSLKLKWRFHQPISSSVDIAAVEDEPGMTYTLEMANSAAGGTFSPLTTSNLSTRAYRVTRLSESTSYRFRVRACSDNGGNGEWSDEFVASTSRAPPPTVKSAPRVSHVTETSCQIEWEPAKLTNSSAMNAGEKLLYSVQVRSVASSSSVEGAFETIYKGASTCYQLRSLARGSVYKVRVCSVRISDSGVEMESASSPAATFSTISPATSSCEENSTSKVTYLTAIRDSLGFIFGGGEQQYSDRQWAALILVAFSVMALFVAFILQRFIPEASSAGETGGSA